MDKLDVKFTCNFHYLSTMKVKSGHEMLWNSVSFASSTVVEKNPLVVDLVPDIPSKIKADMWFQKVQVHIK